MVSAYLCPSSPLFSSDRTNAPEVFYLEICDIARLETESQSTFSLAYPPYSLEIVRG